MPRFPAVDLFDVDVRGCPMGSSRYDRVRPVGEREAAAAAALRAIAELLDGWPGIPSRAVAGQVARVLHAVASELANGRAVPIEVRRSVRALAEALRREMAPPVSCEPDLRPRRRPRSRRRRGA